MSPYYYWLSSHSRSYFVEGWVYYDLTPLSYADWANPNAGYECSSAYNYMYTDSWFHGMWKRPCTSPDLNVMCENRPQNGTF